MPSHKLPVFSVKNFKKPFLSDPDFYIRTFQEHRSEHPFIMKPHRHDFYLLMVFTKGFGTHTIDMKEYEVSRGSVFFMSPGEMHSWRLSDDTDGFVLMFNSSFLIINARDSKDVPFFSLRNKIHFGKLRSLQLPDFAAILKTIHKESQTGLNEQTAILRAYLDILLLKLRAAFAVEMKQTSGSSAGLLSKLEDSIEENYKKHFPVSKYAEGLAISAVQLNILSKNYLNKSVNDLIHERLIAEAKRLLVYTNLTVSEISSELNFSDNSYFSKFFKKMTSYTPDQFRKMILATTNT